jgi:hypothetical protein
MMFNTQHFVYRLWMSKAGISVSDPDPIRIHRILLPPFKNSKKNLDSYYFVTAFDVLSLKNDVTVPSKSNKQETL